MRALSRWWRALPIAWQLTAVTLSLVLPCGVALHETDRREHALQAAQAGAVARLQRVDLLAARLDASTLGLQSAVRGYMLTGDEALLERFGRDTTALHAMVDSLAQLGAERPAAAGLARAIRRWTANAAVGIRMRREADDVLPRATRRRMLARGSGLMEDARRQYQALIAATAIERRDTASATAAALRAGRREESALWWVLGLTITLTLVLLTGTVTATLRAIIAGAKALADGQHDSLRLTGLPRSTREAQAVGAAFDRLARDISERETILRDGLLQMTELEQLKTEFVSTVSHELRTPLTSIRGSLGLALGTSADQLPPRVRSLLQIAAQNTERLIRLINDILDVEKIDSGQVQLRRDSCDMAAVVRTSVAEMEGLAHEARVTIAVEAPEALPITGDADRLVQVVTNLLSNALKFSPSGSTVRVQLDTAGAMARLRVVDQGPGIPPEFQRRIFGRFQQAESGDARYRGGTGLGLAITRGIVELHAGRIHFQTAAGEGTTFTVELPYVPSELAVHEELPAGAPAAGMPRLLIVDGDAATLNVLSAHCGALASVRAVRTAAEARRALRGELFDAVVIDPELEDGAGEELVRALRERDRYAGVPVLLYSAREYTTDELRGLTLVPTHAFVKSRDREDDLVLRLRAVLALSPRRHAA